MLNSTVSEEQDNKRLDQVLAELYPEYSRSKLQEWLSQGYILLDGKADYKGKYKVKVGSTVSLDEGIINSFASSNLNTSPQPEAISLDIVYQDKDIIILNKPANLVVHPAAGNRTGTLVNGLLYHFPELASLPRAGVVHRLDKDTTGLMVVARNLMSHNSIVKQLQERSITRKYIALVHGLLITGGEIEEPIGRHKSNRLKMAVLDEDDSRAKYALTTYRILKKYAKHTLLECKLATGRTHQIRVHMAHIGYPLVGDQLYGRAIAAPKGCFEEDRAYWQGFKRQALAAVELGFIHPSKHEYVDWHIDLPDDMRKIVSILEQQ